MNPQLLHSLKQVLVAFALSALAIVGAAQTDILQGLGLDPLLYGAIVSAVIAAAVRTVEGFKDGQRAAGDVANFQPSDVGFKQVEKLAKVDQPAALASVNLNGLGDVVGVDLKVVDPSPPVVPVSRFDPPLDPLPYSQD